MVTKSCDWCGRMYTTGDSEAHERIKFCSRRCENEANSSSSYQSSSSSSSSGEGFNWGMGCFFLLGVIFVIIVSL
jgi:hypothetical protein